MDKKRTVLLILLLIGFLLPLLSGCQTPAGRSAGEVVDDTTIGAQVKAKLFNSSQLSGFAIDVNVFEGTVTLTGAVDTPEQKSLAEELTKSTRGVQEVNNLLQMKKADK